jgi:tetratricopeptide (TPR) repeat protein
MAKVSLRIYNREIESLIDQGRLDEAVAHCRHILQMFSKHLETYRLLGKAYLEAKRYEEAVDVFSRVLMAVPDDFVSHVGMSIIRDDQNQLDDAIWHMERAFEAQPSNAAIQSELQRLFGRRDGVEPPKIRMTRGALAHMYLQGELYHQAISEIKAVLAQDSQRDDMKTLLARAYFHSGQRADASDICAQLLKHYPYAFDANRIMLELLQGSEPVENTQVYRHRVNELDPYAAFAQGTVFRSSDVADAAVSLERLDYKEAEAEPERDWRSAGISLGTTEAEPEPDWLRAENLAPSIEETEPAPPAAQIPDFLREAGWVESSGRAEEPTSFEPEAAEAEDLAPADLPDWLKAMAPSEPEAAPPSSSAQEESDWLANLRGESEAIAGTEQPALPDWLSGLDAQESEAAPPAQEQSLPDWLQPLSAPSEPSAVEPPEMAAPPVEIPAEEHPLDAPLVWRTEIPSEQPAPEAPVIPAAEIPMEEPTIEAPVTPSAEIPVEEPVFETPAPVVDLPPTLETLGTSAREQDDALAWLESLAAKHGAKAEELVTDPSLRSEEPPQWVQQARVLAESQPDFEPLEQAENAAPAEAEFVEPIPDEGPKSVEAPADETGMWLRGLAERQDAIFVEETPPSGEVEETSFAEEPPLMTEGLETTFVRESSTIAEVPQADLGEEPPLVGEVPEAAVESATDLADWLNKLDETPAEAGTAEAAMPMGEPEPAREPSELPAWLSQAAAEEADFEMPASEPAASKEAAVEETSDLPAWLRGLDEEQPSSMIEPAASDELPAWLQKEADLADEPEPTMPTDWHPLETTAGVGEETQPVQVMSEEERAQEVPAREEAAPEMPTPSELEVESGAEVPAPVESASEPPAPYEPEMQAPEEFQPEPSAPAMQPDLQQQAAMELPPEPEPEAQAGLEPVTEPEAEALPGSEMQGEELSIPPVAEPEPMPQGPVAPPPTLRKAPASTPAGRRQTSTLAPIGDPALAIANSEMNRGNIPAAVEYYGRLIRRGKFLEEIIRELRESLYRYPIEVTIWQTLGDAYMRQNRLQEALDAYTKAEELLR